MQRPAAWLLASIACALLGASELQAQTIVVSGDPPRTRAQTDLPKGTGLILGRVIDPGDGDNGVEGVFVRLALLGSGAPALEVMTDGQGRFVYRDLPKGRYQLSTTRSGYVRGTYGKHLPDTGLNVNNDWQPLELAEDEHRGDVVVKMWKHAAIGGMVRDERGEPVVGITVRALAVTYTGGQRHYSIESTNGGAYTVTDDRGMFRLSSLIPGEYIVCVPVVSQTVPRGLARLLSTPPVSAPKTYSDSNYGSMTWISGGSVLRPVDGIDDAVGLSIVGASPFIAGRTADGHLLVYEMQFHPGSPSMARATPIDLGSGEERSGVDFTLRPVRAVRVSGRATGPEDTASDLVLRLVRADSDALTSDPSVAQTVTDTDGTFTFLGVSPGEYTIQALIAPRPARSLSPSAGTSVVTGSGGSSVTFVGTEETLPTEPTWYAAQPVSVGDDDVGGVSVVLQRGAAVSGHIELRGANPASFSSSKTFYVERADGTQSKNLTLLLTRADARNNVRTTGQPAGRYFIRPPVPGSDWFFAGAMYRGRDLSIDPIDLAGTDVDGVVFVFRDRPGAELNGVVRRDDAAGVAFTAAVVVFPVDRTSWGAMGQNPRNFRTVGVLAGGRYTVSDLPAGDYFVAPLPASRRDWALRTTLEALSRTAARVTLGDGEKRTLDLVLPRPPGGGLDASGRPPGGHGPWVDDDQAQAPPRDLRLPPPAGTGRIAGVVVTGDPAQPARRAVVTLSASAPIGTRVTITDDEGRFEFGELAAGRFTLSAEKAAFLTTRYGAARPGRSGTSIALEDGQQVTDIRLDLVRGGVITGTIRDESGRPVNGALVQAMQYRTVSGVRQLASYSGSASMRLFNLRTDDRGSFRIYGLEPGEYAIGAGLTTNGSARETTPADVRFAEAVLRAGSASPPPMPSAAPETRRPSATVPVFYPGTTDPTRAGMIAVAAGQEVTGIDFVLQPVPAATVRGTVSPPTPNLEVRLINLNPLPGGTFTILGVTRAFPNRPGPDGRFVFTGVVPGSYSVVVTTAAAAGRGAPPGSGRVWAMADVTVSGVDVDNLALTLQPAMKVSGSVVFDAATLTPPALSDLRAALTPRLRPGQVSVGQMQVQVTADGTFAIDSVMPGRYVPRVFTPSGATGWIVRSAMLDGRDVADTGFDVGPGDDVGGLVVTFTDRPAEVSGVLQDGSGRPAPDFFIILFPSDRALWRSGARRIQQVRPASDGRFVLRNLPAGDYRLATVTDIASGERYDPAYLEQLVGSSIALTLAEGEKKVQDIQIRK